MGAVGAVEPVEPVFFASGWQGRQRRGLLLDGLRSILCVAAGPSGGALSLCGDGVFALLANRPTRPTLMKYQGPKIQSSFNSLALPPLSFCMDAGSLLRCSSPDRCVLVT